VVSPDEGAMTRNLVFASALSAEVGMFYKQRDYTEIVDGRNRIISHEFLGSPLDGKHAIVVDDMISSGDSMLEVATKLKDMGAGNIYICAAFGLFNAGFKRFDEAYKNGLFSRVFTTNTVYRPQALLEREWYSEVDLSKYLSYIIDSLNHDLSISRLLNPADKIRSLLEIHNAGRRRDGQMTLDELAGG